MADEVVSLKVLITGDAAQLQSAITQTEAALKKLENTQNKSNKNDASSARDNTKAKRDNTSAVKENDDALKNNSDSLDKSSKSYSKNTEESKKNSSQHKKTSESLKKTSSSLKSLGEGVDSVTKPLQTAAAITAAGGVAAVKFAMDYETAFTGVKKTVDGTDAELNALSKDIRQLATEIPVSAVELANLAAVGGQLGVKVNDIEKFTETIAGMGVATNLAGEEGASALARIINVTGESMDNVDRIGSSIVALGNNSATTEAEIAEMAVRMGKFGNTVGIDAPKVLAYSAALSSMGIEAQAGGSAIGRTWTEIEKVVASGGATLNAYAKYAGVSAEEFKKRWSTDASGAFAGLIKGLSSAENLTLALEELGISDTIDQQAVMALANNYDLLADSLELSTRAYEENNALAKEAEAAYATTANQLKLAGNNIVEAAMGIGEMLLPSVVDATGGIKEFAQGLANMSDGGKQAVITIGKWVIGLGAAGKATAGTIKGVGSLVEGYGKLKTAVSAGGALAKFAPALTSIGAAAPYAAAGIAAVGTAVYVGKKAYDAWYDSQYRWSKGLSEGNEKIEESLDKYKQLSDIQGEIKDLKLTIENPQSSQEQVKTAQTRLEEIKELLSEEYDLVINSDNSNLEEAVNNLTQRSENELQQSLSSQQQKLNSLLSTYEEDKVELLRLQIEYGAADDAYTYYNTLYTKLDTLNTKLQVGKITQEEYNKGFKELQDELGTENVGGTLFTEMDEAKKIIDDLGPKIGDLTASVEEYKAISTEMANWQTELLGMKALEGDAEGVSQALSDMGTLIRDAELDLDGYAQKAALAMNGVKSLDDAWTQAANGDGTALNNIVKDYIRASTEFGASAQKTAVGAALIKKGFNNIHDAVKGGKLEAVTQQANELAASLEGMEGKKIEISAEGDISVFDTTLEKVTEIQKSDGVTVKVTAEGDISVLDEAGNEVRFLDTNEAVSLQVNAEGNIEVLNEAGEVIQTIPQDVETNVNATTNYTKGKQEPPSDENAKVNYKKGWQNSPSDEDAKVNYKLGKQDEPENKTAYITYVENKAPKARGTSDFEGGLAMINDQRGVSDPRELVEIDGKGYIFEGRDVVLPLPKHSKVYTAAQTKAIMAGKGIPHYASGKDNEAFEAAKADWTHYTKVNNVSAAEELEHWNKLLKQFAKDAEVVKEIQEEIFSATKQLWNEELEAMEYALDMGEISNEEYFEKLRQYRDENLGAETDEYKRVSKELKALSSEMYNQRIEDSYNWLRHEEKYNNLSVNDYIAGLGRMEEYTREYYEQGIISYSEMIDRLGELNEQKLDKISEGVAKGISDWEDSADWYFRQSETYGWGFDGSGDSKVDFYGRKADEYARLLEEGNLNLEQYAEIQRKRDEALLDQYTAQQDKLNELLDEQKDAISSLQTQFSNQINALQETWTAEDRAESIEELQEKLRIYSGAATLEGKEEYERLQDELKSLQREEELYQLEQQQAAEIAKLESQYSKYADEQQRLLRESISSQVDLSSFTRSVEGSTNDILERIDSVINAIEASAKTATGNTSINQVINNNISDRLSLTAAASILTRTASILGGGH